MFMTHGGGNRGSFFDSIFGFGFCFPSFLSALNFFLGKNFLWAGFLAIFLLRRYVPFLPAQAFFFPALPSEREA